MGLLSSASKSEFVYSPEELNCYAPQMSKDAVDLLNVELGSLMDNIMEFVEEDVPYGSMVTGVFELMTGKKNTEDPLRNMLNDVVAEESQGNALKKARADYDTAMNFLSLAKNNTATDNQKKYIWDAHQKLLDTRNTLLHYLSIDDSEWSETTCQLFYLYYSVLHSFIFALGLVHGTTKEAIQNEINSTKSCFDTVKPLYLKYRESRTEVETTYHIYYNSLCLLDEFTGLEWESNISSYRFCCTLCQYDAKAKLLQDRYTATVSQEYNLKF